MLNSPVLYFADMNDACCVYMIAKENISSTFSQTFRFAADGVNLQNMGIVRSPTWSILVLYDFRFIIDYLVGFSTSNSEFNFTTEMKIYWRKRFYN